MSGFEKGIGRMEVYYPVAFPNKSLLSMITLSGSETVNPIDCMYSTVCETNSYFKAFYSKPRNEYQGFIWFAIGY